MPSTYSSSLRIELIGSGEQSGTWGTTTNTNLGTLIDTAVAGNVSVSVTTANQALTAANGATDQARQAILTLTTTTTAAFAIYAPPQPKQYIIHNTTVYAATIYNSTVLGNTTAAGLGVTIAAGGKVTVFSDATNFRDTAAANLTGAVTSVGSATSLGSFTSAQLLGALTDETGTGSAVFATSPTFNGTPAAPTASPGNNSTQIATTAYTVAAIAAIPAAPSFPTGTVMLFVQTASPTGWTKSTTHNDKALRVVSGTVTSGGTTAFSSVFANQTPTITLSGLSAGATTLSTAQIPSHTHNITVSSGNSPNNGVIAAVNSSAYEVSRASSATGGGGSHTHTVAGSGSSSAVTLNVAYVDVIIATKD